MRYELVLRICLLLQRMFNSISNAFSNAKIAFSDHMQLLLVGTSYASWVSGWCLNIVHLTVSVVAFWHDSFVTRQSITREQIFIPLCRKFFSYCLCEINNVLARWHRLSAGLFMPHANVSSSVQFLSGFALFNRLTTHKTKRKISLSHTWTSTRQMDPTT